MDIIIGKHSGFCAGVNHTVLKTIKELENGIVYSLGDIVHNEEVINELEKRGLIVVNSISKIPEKSKVIIRAHGESIETYQKLDKKHIDIIDLTCGKVKIIHKKIQEHKDSFIIIIGKKNHPEAIAHKSYSSNSSIVENKNDIKKSYTKYLNSGLKDVYVFSQTTFNETLFDELVNEIKACFVNVKVIVDNTICHTTSIRQQEAIDLSQKVNKMIIVGGKNSSNTKELAILSQKYCKDVLLIQTYQDLKDIKFNKSDIVGIMAGASTPNYVVDEVINYLSGIYKRKK